MNLNPPVLPISPSIRSSFLDPTNPKPNPNSPQHSQPPPPKKKRNLPGTPDPEAEVIALSPRSLMATNRFVCEVCGKGFQRDQNLQLHRRGHNLPWRLRQRGVGKEAPRKKVYMCPVETCVHHDPSRALGDLTGIKKHYSRKHGEKKWKCHKCSKRYAVQSDWKAHSKTCGTKEYSCDCGTIFSRKDSFVTHRAFCDALVQETARLSGDGDPVPGIFVSNHGATLVHHSSLHQHPQIREEHKSIPNSGLLLDHRHQLNTMHEQPPNSNLLIPQVLQINDSSLPIFPTECKAPVTTAAFNRLPEMPLPSSSTAAAAAAAMSATALLQKATQIGSSASHASSSSLFAGIGGFPGGTITTDGNTCFGATGRGSSPADDVFGGCTRDFLGVGTEECCLKRPPELAGFEAMCSAMDVFGSSIGYRS